MKQYFTTDKNAMALPLDMPTTGLNWYLKVVQQCMGLGWMWLAASMEVGSGFVAASLPLRCRFVAPSLLLRCRFDGCSLNLRSGFAQLRSASLKPILERTSSLAATQKQRTHSEPATQQPRRWQQALPSRHPTPAEARTMDERSFSGGIWLCFNPSSTKTPD